MDSKIREGLQHIAAAEKCMKTSFFKWSADLDGAASEYTKAANCFKNAKSYLQASDAFKKAANAQLKSEASYENAALMLKEMQQIDEAVDLLKQASRMLTEHGSPVSAAQSLVRGAKICEATKTAAAVELYLEASALHQIEDKRSEAVDCIDKAARLQLKLKQFTKVLKTMQEQRNLYSAMEKYPMVFQVTLGMVIVQLQLDDTVAADKCFKDATEYPGFADSEFGELIEVMLKSIDEEEVETFQKCIRSPLILHHDNEIAKLARDLRPSRLALENVSRSSASGNAIDEPESDSDVLN